MTPPKRCAACGGPIWRKTNENSLFIDCRICGLMSYIGHHSNLWFSSIIYGRNGAINRVEATAAMQARIAVQREWRGREDECNTIDYDSWITKASTWTPLDCEITAELIDANTHRLRDDDGDVDDVEALYNWHRQRNLIDLHEDPDDRRRSRAQRQAKWLRHLNGIYQKPVDFWRAGAWV